MLLAVFLVEPELEPAAQRETSMTRRISAPSRGLAVIEDVLDEIVERIVGGKTDALEQEVHALECSATEHASFEPRRRKP